MKKQELIEEFVKNHRLIITYIDQLNELDFNYKFDGKWTAGQQLQHILLTIRPFPKALFSKEYLLMKYGEIKRSSWNYKSVIENYCKSSLKAPEQFLPDNKVSLRQKVDIILEIKKTLTDIVDEFNKYSEMELDTIILPHPLLGNLTLREMFYLMSYHPLHHKKQIEQIFYRRSEY